VGFGSGGLAIGSVMHGQEDFFTRAALWLSKYSSLTVSANLIFFRAPEFGARKKGCLKCLFHSFFAPQIFGARKPGRLSQLMANHWIGDARAGGRFTRAAGSVMHGPQDEVPGPLTDDTMNPSVGP
jgi:hypothetical protein